MQQTDSLILCAYRISKTLLFLFAAILYCGASSVRGQECYPHEVIDAVNAQVKLKSAQIPLMITELPRLEEKIIGLEQESDNESSELRVVRFYEVTPKTYEIINGRSVNTTIQLDNDSVWVVGVGPNRAIYRLAGFSDSVSDFSRLMKDLGVQVKDSEDALDVFDVFLRLTHSPELFSSVVGDVMQLQSVALQDFRLRFPESKRVVAFDRWWKAIPASTKEVIAPPNVRVHQSSFDVIYYRYNQGTLRKESINISNGGSVGPEKSTVVIYKSVPSKVAATTR